jgi:hypothetical protein
MSILGCKGSNEEYATGSSQTAVGGKTADGRYDVVPAQSLRPMGNTVTDGKDLQKMLASYEEDLTRAAGRVQASSEDRWYATAHKYNMDIQINSDMNFFLRDVDTLVKSELPPSAVSPRIHEQSAKLQQDTEHLASAVQEYLSATTDTGRAQWLKAVRQNVEVTRKQLLAVKKLADTPAATSAKI